MLHNESRNLLVKSYAKEHNARKLAEVFGVSRWTVYRLNTQMRKTGSVELRLGERGRKAKLSEADKAAIRRQIQEQPDITIKEVRESLKLDVCEETIRKATIALGYRLKKKMIHASEQERPRCAGKAEGMERIRTKAER